MKTGLVSIYPVVEQDKLVVKHELIFLYELYSLCCALCRLDCSPRANRRDVAHVALGLRRRLSQPTKHITLNMCHKSTYNSFKGCCLLSLMLFSIYELLSVLCPLLTRP